MTVSNKKFVLYPNAPWYFALAIVTTWVGFSMSYFARLGQVTIYHHLHGATAGLWLALMVVQPILYKSGKLKLHRKVGWIASLTLVPLMVLGGLKMMQLGIINQASYPPGVIYRLSFIDAYSLIQFILFYVLSIYNGKRIHAHARYMACTVLTILPPAITRLLFFVPWFTNFNRTLNGSFFITELILLILIWDDKRSGKFRAPYFVALAIFAVLHITMDLVGGWPWWKEAMDWYAGAGR
jgi:hypothetical protein